MNLRNDDTIISEGFWWSNHYEHLPKVTAGKPFEDQPVIIRLMFLLQKHLDKLQLDYLRDYEAKYEQWRQQTSLPDRVAEVGKPQYEEGTEKVPVVCYRGSSRCRICDIRNGSCEYIFGGYRWPAGYLHYVEEHNVEPSAGFKEMLARAALWMAHPEVAYTIENGIDGNVAGVQCMMATENLVALSINLRVKRTRITGLGSTTIDGKDVPVVYVDTLDGADGDDTGVVLLAYPGWTVWSTMAVKHGVHVCLMQADALYGEKESESD